MRSAIEEQVQSAADIVVAAGECRFTNDPGCRLIARELRSSVAVAVHEPKIGLAALLHFSLPSSRGEARESNPWLCADTAIPLLFAYLREIGAEHRGLAVYAAGGALDSADGKRNVLALRRLLWREGVLLKGDDTGGSLSRSVWLEAASGRIIVRSRSRAARLASHSPQGAELCHFAS